MGKPNNATTDTWEGGWVDTHCHLDAPEFDTDRDEVIARAKSVGVLRQVVPAVMPSTFGPAREAAHRCGGAYALGIHPLYIQQVPADAVEQLEGALQRWQDDPRLVAVGEIGLDHFVPGLQDEGSRALQERIYAEQLELAARRRLPVILHVRRSADGLLKHLRRLRDAGRPVPGGIAHAFNGSVQQAMAFIELGLKLGFGGAMTFERALQIRRLASELPADALVLETDAPDIPPHWLYRTAEQRAQGLRSRNEPAELPRIAETLAALRGWSLDETRRVTTENALAALPRLRSL
ncbi:TatD family hydrolase [Aquabacterium parvum]|uniref:TatD family hydrolase n=1 Tax=Aquabacterium parvum TaxID=70584 RepID=UPI000718D732|nr:TatD family hydrolase [Aquabacterium parvum]MBU0916986.1 TatD family hydrolase [Gammaproteobacteria bacterium]